MININQLTSQLAKMPDGMLQKFASMHKDDPYTVALALSESNRRKDLRSSAQAKMAGQQMPKVVDQEIGGIAPQQLPEEVGIGQLPAQNIQNMAAGGIVAFDEGGEVPRFQNRGEVQDPFRNASRELTELILATAAKYNIDPSVAMRLVKQESGFDPNATSKRGAVGLTQLMPAAAKDMGLSEEDRFDPVKNVNAGFGYLRKQLDKYGNDYSKALSAYNWGGSNLDKHLAKNEGKVNKIGLPKETADYLTKILPMGAAGASELPKEGAAKTAQPVQAKSTNEIPSPVTKESRAAAAADTGAPKAITGNQAVIGAGETGLQYLTGLAAIPTAGAYSLYRKAMYGENPEENFRKYAGEVTYAPRTEGGKAVSEGFARTLEDLKIPPYLAHMGNLSPRKSTPDMRPAVSEMAAAKAAKAGLPSAENPQGILRLAGPTTDQTMVQGPKNAPSPVKQGKAMAAYASDVDDALAWQKAAEKASKGTEGTLPEVLERNAAINRAQNIAGAVGASPAVQAASAAPGGAGQSGIGLPSGWGSDLGVDSATEDLRDKLTKKEPDEIVKAAPAAADTKGGIAGLFSDPLFLMGMNMMASQNPRFLGATGEAGLGTAKYMAEQRKEESERAYKEALAKHYGVDPFVQRLRALQDPENMRMFNLMKEAEGEPALMRELVTEYLKNPAGMSVLKTENPALYNAIRMQASRVMAPRPMNELPGASAATRPPV